MAQAEVAGSEHTEAGGGGSKYLALTAMLFAVAMTFIDQTIVSIAVPRIQGELDLSLGRRAVGDQRVHPRAGRGLRLRWPARRRRRVTADGADRHRRLRRVVGAVRGDPDRLVRRDVDRLLPGAAGVLRSRHDSRPRWPSWCPSFPLRERGKALAIFFGVSGGLTAIGPIAGGYLTQWTWRAIFWINVPIAIIAIVLDRHGPHQHQGPPRADRLSGRRPGRGGHGAERARASSRRATWSWSNVGTWLCIVGGLAIIVLFVFVAAAARSTR